MKYHTLKDIENKVPKPGSFKHFLRIQEHGGRVVKGVNTTADVGVDAIKKQAAKFGNKVDKDGRPPTLSKKVKGSKTNVLFNLGMTESVDNTDESMLYYAKMAESLGELASSSKVYVDMDGVLADFFGEWKKLIGKDWRKVKDIEPALQKIRDTDDFWLELPLLPQAKNLLDIIKRVKGSYNILSSPLPNDPNSEPHKREWIKKNLDFFPPENVIITHDKAKFATNADGTPNILIDDFGQNIAKWEAAGGEGFKHKDHKFERTAKAIQQQFKEPVKERPLTKGEENKKEKYVKGMKKKKGDFKDRYGKDADAVMYATATKMAKEALISGLYTTDQVLELLENFADGKKSGKSRPGRVKRSGASCGGSVTELRKKAKNASGERAKMYHWCANMKSGRKRNEGAEITMWTNPEYQGADVDDKYYKKQPVKIVDVSKLTPFEPADKMEPKDNHDNMMKFVDKIKAGEKIKPVVIVPHEEKLLIVDGHHRYFAHLKAGADKIRAVIADPKDLTWRDDVPESINEGRKKKSESVTVDFEMINLLIESTDNQLHEGIKDSLAKLPKNILAKVQPILKKIPKTGKSLVLIATLLGVMVNAAAAGDMGKVDVQMDKLNGMATQSTTMDQPTTADKGGFDLDKVNYDREYKGDVNKVFAVQDKSVKDAKAMYDKLGGVSNANYEKMQDIVFKKIDDLRSDYKDATAKKGLSGKDALHSDEFKDFRKQSNDLKIMLSKAMDIMTKDAGATGSILKPTGKIIGK